MGFPKPPISSPQKRQSRVSVTIYRDLGRIRTHSQRSLSAGWPCRNPLDHHDSRKSGDKKKIEGLKAQQDAEFLSAYIDQSHHALLENK